jgi:hypothetical protein
MSSCSGSCRLHRASTHAAQMQQQLIGTTLQKKQLSIEGVCAVEQVSMKSPSAGEQVIVKPPTGDCCPLPNAL